MWAIISILLDYERVPPLTVAPIAVNDLHIKVNHHQGPLKHIKQCLLSVYHVCWTDVISLYYYIKCKSAVFLDQTSVFEAPFCEIYGWFFFIFFQPVRLAAARICQMPPLLTPRCLCLSLLVQLFSARVLVGSELQSRSRPFIPNQMRV